MREKLTAMSAVVGVIRSASCHPEHVPAAFTAGKSKLRRRAGAVHVSTCARAHLKETDMSQIRVNYEEMAASAQAFLQMSQTADELVKQVKAEADKLSAGWEGVADAEFLAQIDSCMVRLQHTPLMMNEISVAVKTASDLIQKAEEEAKAQIAAIIVDDAN
jgi:WXG100 family type VII secretion target